MLGLGENWNLMQIELIYYCYHQVLSVCFIKLAHVKFFVLVGVLLFTCRQTDIYVFSIIDMTTVDQFNVIY